MMRHLKRFNESTDDIFTEELQDFCETNLAYLMDEGVEIQVTENSIFHPQNKNLLKAFNLNWFNPQTIRIILQENPKTWDEIKDHMIPFLIRLNNEYNIQSYHNKADKNVKIEVTRDLEAARQNWPHRKTELFYQVNKLINDDIKSGLTYDRGDDVLESYITEFEFMIDGYKQEPKKGILTKIKSYFK
jgi:hypothetical protein